MTCQRLYFLEIASPSTQMIVKVRGSLTLLQINLCSRRTWTTSKLLYTSLVQPLMEYCDIVWSNADNTILQRLLRLQKRGARIILQKKIREDRTANLYCELGWVSLFERWNFHKCLTVFKCLNGIYPSYLRRLFSYNSDVHHYNTRNRANLHMVKITSKSGYRSFAYSAAKLFNNLDYATKRSLTLKEFVNNYWSK